MLTQNWLMVTNEFKLYKRGKYQIQCAANENKKTFSLLPLFVLLGMFLNKFHLLLPEADSGKS